MAMANPDFFGSLLLASEPGANRSAQSPYRADDRRRALNRMGDRTAKDLRDGSTGLRHPNDMVLLAVADLDGG